MNTSRFLVSALVTAAFVSATGLAYAEAAGGAQSADYNGMQSPGTGTGPGMGVGYGPNTGGGGSQGHESMTKKGFYDSSQYEQPNLSAYESPIRRAEYVSPNLPSERSSRNRAEDHTQGR